MKKQNIIAAMATASLVISMLIPALTYAQDSGDQTGTLSLTCNTQGPVFATSSESTEITPGDFNFYPDGASGSYFSSISLQYGYSDISGTTLDAENMAGAPKARGLFFRDVRDPSQNGCNDGLTVNVTVQEMETPGDEDGLYFEPNPTTNSPSDPSIPLTGLYVLSSNDSCATNYTAGADGVCYRTNTGAEALCGNGDGAAATQCDGDEATTPVNYVGTSFASTTTFTTLTGNALGTGDNLPASVNLVTYTDGEELFGEAEIATAWHTLIPQGQEASSYEANILYEIMPS